MDKVKYTLTEEDLQLLYPLCSVSDIIALFPEHAPKEWTIRRRYRRLGLAPINSAYKSYLTSLESHRPEDKTREEWRAECEQTTKEILEAQCEKIWEKIRTVESRSV